MQNQNSEIEKAVVAACMILPENMAVAIEAGITAEHFGNLKYRALWLEIPVVSQQHGLCDEILLIEHLRQKYVHESAISRLVGPEYKDYLMIDFISLESVLECSGLEGYAGFRHWVELLKEAYSARVFAEHLSEQLDSVKTQPKLVKELIEQTATWVVNQNSNVENQTLQPIQETAHTAWEQMDALRRGEREPGLPFGLIDLDQVAQMTNGSMTVLAARPSMGKTALALKVAYNAARRYDTQCLIFSLEMSNVEMTKRLIAMHGSLDIRRYQENVSAAEPHDVQQMAGEVSQLPILLEEAAPLTVFRMRATARRAKLRHNVGLIIIDYLQLADSDNPKSSREQAIGEISRNCKLMAKELNVPVLALAQLNRQVEQRDPPRPRLSDLRDSGTIEQDADTVIFISPTVTDPESGKYRAGGKMLLDVAKNRHGPVDTVPVTFTPSLTLFENFAPAAYGH